ncbi:MAG TPA: exonuclease domain-containing protein [Vicinamibacterales bacterium]
MRPLTDLDVLIVDCQATMAAPRGQLLEIGWARAGGTPAVARARLIRLPEGVRIQPAVARITGISEAMCRDGAEPEEAVRELLDEAAGLEQQPAPAVAHFARFEQQLLRTISPDAPLDFVCTHAIARRLLPDLPRCSLRALAGYFGSGVGTLRRSAEHVTATAFVWRELVRLLEQHGVRTWEALHAWLAASPHPGRRRRVWPMPRELRLTLPDAPGVYRLLRSNGDVLYVGKAASLRARVNSHFRKQAGVSERALEMLSQARGLSHECLPTALEAALFEADEIKRHRPPYNIALAEGRSIWFASRDLTCRNARPSRECAVGPFAGTFTLDRFASLLEARRTALGGPGLAPDADVFDAGYARFLEVHPELARTNLAPHARLLRLGTRLWRDGRRDEDAEADTSDGEDDLQQAWTPEQVQFALERIAIGAALVCRRARWITRLAESAITWCEPGSPAVHLLVIAGGKIAHRETLDTWTPPPVPPGYARPAAARHEAFTLATFDRLRVLTTELKRLAAAGAPVAVRLGPARPLTGRRLASVLGWL